MGKEMSASRDPSSKSLEADCASLRMQLRGENGSPLVNMCCSETRKGLVIEKNEENCSGAPPYMGDTIKR